MQPGWRHFCVAGRTPGAFALSIALSCALVACSADTPNDPSIAWLTPRDPMTPAERMAAIDALTDTLDAILPGADTPWEERDLVAEIRLAAEKLAELPEVAAVMYTEFDQSATIVLNDGFTVLLINNRPPRPAAATRRLETPRPHALPGAARAVTASYDGGQEVADEMASRLDDAGYDVLPLGASLDDMRQYEALGFLYIDSHSANFLPIELIFDGFGRVKGYQRLLDEMGNFVQASYVIETSTKVDVENLADISGELARGEVTVDLSQGYLGGWMAHLAVSEAFIERNWSLDEGVVILHSCYSGSPPFSADQTCFGNCPPGTALLDPAPLRNTLLSKGANVVVSFDKGTFPVQAAPSLNYFVDRLVGANVEAPTSPAQRPFDWMKVQTAMLANGLASFQLGKKMVQLVFEGSSDPVAMAPGIRSLDIVDDTDASGALMTLKGTFGTEQGRVSLGGQSLSTSSWDNEEIVVQLPYAGTLPAHGGVQIQSSSEISGNAVPLTRWRGAVALTIITNDTLVQIASAEVEFRGDVHPIRQAVDVAPSHRVVTAYISTPGVTGNTTAAGTFTSESGTVTLYGGGEALQVYGKAVIDELVNGNRPTPSMSGVSEFAGLVELDPAQDQARLCLWLEGYHDRYRDGVLLPEADAYFSLSTNFFLADSAKGLLNCFHLTLQDDGSIPRGERSYTAPGINVVFSWTELQVESPPGPTTPS